MRARQIAMAVLLPAMAVALGGCPEPDTRPLAPAMADPGKAVSAPIPSYVETPPEDAPPPGLPPMDAPPAPHD